MSRISSAIGFAALALAAGTCQATASATVVLRDIGYTVSDLTPQDGNVAGVSWDAGLWTLNPTSREFHQIGWTQLPNGFLSTWQPPVYMSKYFGPPGFSVAGSTPSGFGHFAFDVPVGAELPSSLRVDVSVEAGHSSTVDSYVFRRFVLNPGTEISFSGRADLALQADGYAGGWEPPTGLGHSGHANSSVSAQFVVDSLDSSIDEGRYNDWVLSPAYELDRQALPLQLTFANTSNETVSYVLTIHISGTAAELADPLSLPVPEPQTWAQLLAGLAVLLTCGRRRRS